MLNIVSGFCFPNIHALKLGRDAVIEPEREDAGSKCQMSARHFQTLEGRG